MVHAHLQQPVFYLLFLALTNHVLHRHIHIIGGGDVSESKLIIFGDVVVVGIIDDITDVQVSIKQNRCESIDILYR